MDDGARRADNQWNDLTLVHLDPLRRTHCRARRDPLDRVRRPLTVGLDPHPPHAVTVSPDRRPSRVPSRNNENALLEGPCRVLATSRRPMPPERSGLIKRQTNQV
jgi:hypothetical protein